MSLQGLKRINLNSDFSLQKGLYLAILRKNVRYNPRVEKETKKEKRMSRKIVRIVRYKLGIARTSMNCKKEKKVTFTLSCGKKSFHMLI